MSDNTPLEQLHEAIAEFVRVTEGDEPMLSGWVLAYQTQRIIDEPGMLPIVSDSEFVMAPSVSEETVLGLLALTSARIVRQLVDGNDG